jgi:decaprenylphospho-beta-D-erythro-pentofuranosid-2-ulose 2-reductase
MMGATGVPQRVLLVGGTSEIGRALALSWAKRGTRDFIMTERVPGAASKLRVSLESLGARVDTAVLDALEQSSIKSALQSSWVSDIDVVVIALGLLRDQLSIDQQPELAWDVLTVNATASIQIALEVAKRMEEQRHGTIVLLSSVAGQRGRRDNYVYGASKAALDTFAEGLQQRLRGTGVKVLLVRPGYVFSRMTTGVDPAPFAVTLDQSRRRILRALDSDQEVVWIPPILGMIFYVFRMLPRRLWASLVSRTR